MAAVEQFLPLTPAQRARTFLRSDAGFGSDANVDHALSHGWQVLTKSSGGQRPAALARQVAAADWQALDERRWLAVVPPPLSYVRPMQCLLLRWLAENGMLKQAVLLCSERTWSAQDVLQHYDQRGACETEFQADKSGLRICRRRKHCLAAQAALILLSDVAHNLLAWTAHWMFPTSPLARFHATRLIEDVLAIPGRLIFSHDRLVTVQLNELHPHAAETAAGLQRLLDHFGHP